MKARKFEFFLEGMNHYTTPSRSKQISLEEAVSIFEENCFDFDFENSVPIFRGITDLEKGYYLSNPKAFKRVSKNTSNTYTHLMDKLPKWSSYPKRSESLICSLSYRTAQNFSDNGTASLVIPFDNSKIGVCPESDLWDSFGKTLPRDWDLSSFNSSLGEFLAEQNKKSIDLTADEMWEFFQLPEIESQFEDWKKDFLHHPFNRPPVEALKKNDFLSIFEFILDPEINDFRVFTTKNFDYDLADSDLEVWTDGPCLVINPLLGETMNNFRKLVS